MLPAVAAVAAVMSTHVHIKYIELETPANEKIMINKKANTNTYIKYRTQNILNILHSSEILFV